MRGGVVRLIGWGIGLSAAFGVAAALAWGDSSRALGPLVLCLTLALFALVAEVVRLVRVVGNRPISPMPVDLRPADGTAAIVAMAGARQTPNGADPRFCRFDGLDSEPPITPRALDAARLTPPLLGRIAVISLFIGRHGRPWSDPEIARAHASLLRAAAWVEREAIRWNSPVNLEVCATYFAVVDEAAHDVEIGFSPKGDEMQPFETHAVIKALTSASRAATQLGFHDAVDLVAEINARVPADAWVWLLHPREAGHSLAVPLDDTMLAGVSLAVCYAREANFPEPLEGQPYTDPVTIVHELLHLFGASDKYGVPLSGFPPGSVTHREIMRLDESSLQRLRIDPLTAQEIGWPVSE